MAEQCGKKQNKNNMAAVGEDNEWVVVLLPDKRVRTIYTLYKYTELVEHHDELQHHYEQHTQTASLAPATKSLEVQTHIQTRLMDHL